MHTSILSQLIRETKADKGDLTVVWLDFANAYSSIPHKLLETALDHYYIPEKNREFRVAWKVQSLDIPALDATKTYVVAYAV